MHLFFLFILIIIILGAMATLIAAFISIHRARRNAGPFYPAPAEAIRTALAAAGLSRGESFYDLGAGTGKALVIADREFGARATGIELSAAARVIARTNILLHGARAMVIGGDLFAENISPADVVYCFLSERTMPRVEEKLRTELKPGARAVVYGFPLPTAAPVRTIPVRGNWKLFLYEFR